MSAGFAWSGGVRKVGRFFESALSFVITGDTGALTDYMQVLEQVQDILTAQNVGANGLRYDMIRKGPHQLWRRVTGELPPTVRRRIRSLAEKAESCHARLGTRDASLTKALHLHITLINESLNVIDAMDRAWGEYHQAALVERMPAESAAFQMRIGNAMGALSDVSSAIRRYAKPLQRLSRQTGHPPYDSHSLKGWAEVITGVSRLIRELVKDDNGLPYFEKLFHLPDVYCNTNLKQFQVSNRFEAWYRNGARDVEPPTRWSLLNEAQH